MASRDFIGGYSISFPSEWGLLAQIEEAASSSVSIQLVCPASGDSILHHFTQAVSEFPFN